MTRLHAPSVSYPVGRSAFQALLLLALGAAGLAACGLLAWQVAGWRAWLAGLAAVAIAAWAALWWRTQSEGLLLWDGAAWDWSPAGQGLARRGRIDVLLDLQHALLLRWAGEEGRCEWLWAERGRAPTRWAALRRAVYSPAGSAAPVGAEPPPAAP